MLTYDVILENADDKQAIDYANGLVFSEIEQTENNIKYSKYVDSVNGIDVYYDYGADYYFFTDSE